VPWAQLALVLLVVGAFVMVRVLRRRNAARVQARIDAAVAAADATKTEA
jgi:cytochrome c-type biogenesis protein CcmH/NrfF